MRPSRLIWWFHDEGKSIEESINIIAATVYHQSMAPEVGALARKITEGCTTAMCKIRAIHEWLRRRFLYTEDPKEVDTFKSAVYTIHEIWQNGYFRGDCDDATILSAALLKAAGFVVRLMVVSRRPEPDAPLEHILTLVELPGGKKVYVDLTVDAPIDFSKRRVVLSDPI
jgi:hypothetical protein